MIPIQLRSNCLRPPCAGKYIKPLIITAAAFLWQGSVYLVSRWIAAGWTHFDMTTSADRLIPFLPWTVSIYLLCYLFWAVNYYLCATQNPSERNRFFLADALAKAVCFLIFLLIPTTNIRPATGSDTVWDILMTHLYQIDSADNLFPSIHCLVSWFCWISVRQRKDISILYRIFSLVMAAAVCLSTLTTKQHVLADVAGSLLLAEASHYFAGRPKVRSACSAILSRLKRAPSKQK